VDFANLTERWFEGGVNAKVEWLFDWGERGCVPWKRARMYRLPFTVHKAFVDQAMELHGGYADSYAPAMQRGI